MEAAKATSGAPSPSSLENEAARHEPLGMATPTKGSIPQRRCAVRDAMRSARDDIVVHVAETLQNTEKMGLDRGAVSLVATSLSVMVESRFAALMELVPPIDVTEGWDRERLHGHVCELREEVRWHEIRWQRCRRQFEHLAREYRRLQHFVASVKGTLWAGLCRVAEDMKQRGLDGAAVVQRFSSEWPDPTAELSERDLEAMLALTDVPTHSNTTAGGVAAYSEEDVHVRVAEAVAACKAEAERQLEAVEAQFRQRLNEEASRVSDAVAAASKDAERERQIFELLLREYEIKTDNLQEIVDACRSEAETRLSHAQEIKELQVSGMSKQLMAVQHDIVRLKQFAHSLEVDLARTKRSEEGLKMELLERTMAHKRELQSERRAISELSAKLQAVPPREAIVAEVTGPLHAEVSRLRAALSEAQLALATEVATLADARVELDTAHHDMASHARLIDELRAANRSFEEELYRAQETINGLRCAAAESSKELTVKQERISWQAAQMVELRRRLGLSAEERVSSASVGSPSPTTASVTPTGRQREQQRQRRRMEGKGRAAPPSKIGLPSTTKNATEVAIAVTSVAVQTSAHSEVPPQTRPVVSVDASLQVPEEVAATEERAAAEVGANSSGSQRLVREKMSGCAKRASREPQHREASEAEDHDLGKMSLDVNSIDDPPNSMPMPAAAYIVRASFHPAQATARPHQRRQRSSDPFHQAAAPLGACGRPQLGDAASSTLGSSTRTDDSDHDDEKSSCNDLRLRESGSVVTAALPALTHNPARPAAAKIEMRDIDQFPPFQSIPLHMQKRVPTTGHTAAAEAGESVVPNDPSNEESAHSDLSTVTPLVPRAYTFPRDPMAFSVTALSAPQSQQPLPLAHKQLQQSHASAATTAAAAGAATTTTTTTSARHLMCTDVPPLEGDGSIADLSLQSQRGSSSRMEAVTDSPTPAAVALTVDKIRQRHVAVGTKPTSTPTASPTGLLALLTQLRTAQELQEHYRQRLAQDQLALRGIALAPHTLHPVSTPLVSTQSQTEPIQPIMMMDCKARGKVVPSDAEGQLDKVLREHRQLCAQLVAELANCATCHHCPHHAHALIFSSSELLASFDRLGALLNLQQQQQQVKSASDGHELVISGARLGCSLADARNERDGEEKVGLNDVIPSRCDGAAHQASLRTKDVSFTTRRNPRAPRVTPVSLSLLPENYFALNGAGGGAPPAATPPRHPQRPPEKKRPTPGPSSSVVVWNTRQQKSSLF